MAVAGRNIQDLAHHSQWLPWQEMFLKSGVMTYQEFPSVLEPFFSAKRRSCAALNCEEDVSVEGAGFWCWVHGHRDLCGLMQGTGCSRGIRSMPFVYALMPNVRLSIRIGCIGSVLVVFWGCSGNVIWKFDREILWCGSCRMNLVIDSVRFRSEDCFAEAELSNWWPCDDDVVDSEVGLVRSYRCCGRGG